MRFNKRLHTKMGIEKVGLKIHPIKRKSKSFAEYFKTISYPPIHFEAGNTSAALFSGVGAAAIQKMIDFYTE